MRGGTGTTTVREHADKSAATTTMPAPMYAFMTASLFIECRSRDTTRGRRSGQSEFPLKELPHPGGGAHGAAEAVEMYPDRVARFPGPGVARHGHDLIARIGVGHELRDAHAEAPQRPERAADAAALRVARERRRVGRPGDAYVYRQVGPAPR